MWKVKAVKWTMRWKGLRLRALKCPFLKTSRRRSDWGDVKRWKGDFWRSADATENGGDERFAMIRRGVGEEAWWGDVIWWERWPKAHYRVSQSFWDLHYRVVVAIYRSASAQFAMHAPHLFSRYLKWCSLLMLHESVFSLREISIIIFYKRLS